MVQHGEVRWGDYRRHYVRLGVDPDPSVAVGAVHAQDAFAAVLVISIW
jgi:hypothetical protein